MSTWNIEPTAVDHPNVVDLLREYTDEMASRYYGRPATDAEVDQAIAEDPNTGLHPPTGVFLVAREQAELVGCAGIRELEPGIAELKRMYIRPRVRGRGAGARLLTEVERHARQLGYRAIRLDTRDDLVEARRLYAKHGYQEIPAFNDGPYAEHWFEKVLRSREPVR
ncbi:GNAT family N-acetyltransferase [Saccharopolyspora indica]|uniref:GNAT family N-acetyltransferase n=1 Tax=Saccharopolyspora indica TaxID=1229659 RepID=UPI0022EACB6B|nr:GNAT family N-acetyltransferase [Saccharopolyspora indica]MDA3644437.1 GNAT family N-acetyltransferase [Saccharopolyspora indica]